MKKMAFVLAFILAAVMLSPETLASSALLELSRDENGFMTLSGNVGAGENVTLRSVYFGEESPVFPDGVENYEINTEDVRSGKVNYFNVAAGNSRGEYSASFMLPGYGYYLMTAVSESGERKSQLYRYRSSSSDLQPPEDAEKRFTDKSRIFEIENEKFILLDMKEQETVLLPYSDCGVSNGHMLDEYVEGIGAMLPACMSGYENRFELPDSEFFKKYKNIPGAADGVGYFGNETWRVLKNKIDSRDVSEYAVGDINETAEGTYMENICFGETVSVLQTGSGSETVVEFTAPSDGEYKVNTLLSGAGTVKVQLTALQGEKIFDNYSLMTVKYDGTDISRSNSVMLSGGDKLYLHIYPPIGEVKLDFRISCGTAVYSFDSFAKYKNMWWTAGNDGENRFAYSMNTADFGKVCSVSKDSELFVRPIIYLDNSFFLQNKIDIKKAGADVLAAVREHFDRGTLTVYDKYELDTIFNEFGGFSFEVLAYTDGAGNEISSVTDGVLCTNVRLKNTMLSSKSLSVILAVYSDDGGLLKAQSKDVTLGGGFEDTVSLSVDLSGISKGAYAKTFLWNSSEGMKPVSEIKARGLTVSKLTDINADGTGNWRFYTKPAGSLNYTEYTAQTVSGSQQVMAGSSMPHVYWNFKDAENKAYIRPEKTGEEVIEYTVPYSGNWKIEITYQNIGLTGEGTYGGDGGNFSMSYLPKGDTDDSRVFKGLGVQVSSPNPVSNSYSTVINADGGDRILLSANAGTDGYGDCWEIKYSISETYEKGRIIDEGYKSGLTQITGQDSASKAGIKENTVWIGVDGNFGDSEAMKKKILYFKQFIPNLGVVLMTAHPETHCNSDFYEQNGIPVIVQSYGSGFEEYIGTNNAWEMDWDFVPLDSSHWQDMSGTAHAFSLPHYATKEVFSRIAKSAAESGFSGFGFPDYVWMWGARGISGYNPETIKAFVDDLCERDSGLKCDDGVWYFHDYYRYYTGSSTLIVPQDLGLSSWEEYTPLSKTKNTELKNAGVDTTPYWALFDMLCHYEWLKFAQYVSDLSDDNGGICQIMINPEYYPDGVDYLFLNKLANVYMTEDEFFGNTDYLDGAYYRSDYLTKFNSQTKTGGVMEAGGGGNGGAYYTDEIAYLTAFELGALGSLDHLEADFMYQNSGFSKERDGQIISYGMGFSDAKTLGLDKRNTDFTVVSSRNQSRPWAQDTQWKPWDLRLGFDGNLDFYLAKMGYNFDGISQEGFSDVKSDVVVFSPHIVTKSVWNEFVQRLSSGNIKKGIISALRMDAAVTDKLKTVEFSEAAPEYDYSSVSNISLGGYVLDPGGNKLNASRKSISGGIAAALPGDETVLSFKTITKSYPLAVKRTVGNGEMYILLFDDTAAENYEIAEAVYSYILGSCGIKPMFKSLVNTGNLLEGYTETDAYLSAIETDLGASARVYQNGDLTAVGVQNSHARINAQSTLTSTGLCAPYEISGSTSVKVLMSPLADYRYISVPSMTEGSVTADEEGYITLSFDNTSHEMFFLLPKDSAADFNGIKNMQDKWRTALKFGE